MEDTLLQRRFPIQCRSVLRRRPSYGVRRQSVAATALWLGCAEGSGGEAFSSGQSKRCRASLATALHRLAAQSEAAPVAAPALQVGVGRVVHPAVRRVRACLTKRRYGSELSLKSRL